MEETLETNIVLKRDDIEVAGKIEDNEMHTEYEEGKVVHTVPEYDSIIKGKDIVSFAVDQEDSEVSQSSVRADPASSLHMPMYFTDCKTKVLADQRNFLDSGLDPLEPDLTRIVDSVAGTEHLGVNQIVRELKSVVPSYSAAYVFPEKDSLETLTKKERIECDALKIDQDVLKTHSFAENLELSEIKQISDVEGAELTSRLHLSSQLIDSFNRVHFDDVTVQENSLDPLQLGPNKIVNIFARNEHPEVDHITYEMKSAVMQYSIPFMHQESNPIEAQTYKTRIECDTLKKQNNVVKAVSFAENHEISEITGSSIIADAHSNAYVHVHLTDNSSSSLADQQKAHKVDILSSLAVENHVRENKVFNEVKPLLHADFIPSASLEKEPCDTQAHKDNTVTTSCQDSIPNEDIIASNDTHIVQVNEGHKEFTVQNVDEADLVKKDETVNTSDEKSPGCDGCNLFSKLPNLHLDSTSPGTEINNQDTIGPLDNPAFLRTLHYSISCQPHLILPITKDELTGHKSNPDLHSQPILEDPSDLDQGWAWVVLLSGFLANALLGATIYASGVLMLTILKEINPDLTKVSWIGSVFVCAMCLSGPFVEVALRLFGARVTVFCAGIVFSSGFVGASFATSISELILTHGLIAGVGAGFVANPVSVSVGQYFFRYRGLACGLLATGAGAGMLSGGAFISLLLEEYGLSGTYLIWGGILSHTALLGLLLRPSPEERLRVYERNIAATEAYEGFINRSNAVSGFNSMFCSANQSMLSGIDKVGLTKKALGRQTVNTDYSKDTEANLLNSDHCCDDTQSVRVETTNQILPCSQGDTEKYGQDFVVGDLKHTLNNSVISMPRTDSPHMVSTLSPDTLLKNSSDSPLYSSAYIFTASEPAYTSVTPNKLSFMSRSTHGLENTAHGRYKGRSILSRVRCGDHEFPTHKPRFYSSHSVTPNWSNPRSHGSNLCSWFSKSLGLGIRQYTSLSTSPFVTPKVSSPQAIPSCSQDTLANNLHQSSSFCNRHVAAVSHLTHGDDILTSMPTSPTSIRKPLTLSRIHRYRMSVASPSQHTTISRCSVPLSYRGSIKHSYAGEMDTESITSALISHHHHRDMMLQKYPKGSRSISTFMGSVGSIPTALAIVKDDVVRYETYSTAGIPETETGLKDTGIKMLDSLRLLRQKTFLIFLAVCFLWSFGESPVMIYLPSFAVSRGTSQIQASMLYTAMGTGSIIGRFLSGLTASDNIGPALIYSGCLGVAGLLIVVSPLVTSTFLQQVVFSCLAGIYTGSLVPLSSLIVIDMLEIGELATGFGLISMAQGTGYLIGPPLASLFVTTYGYKNLFVFSGVSLLTGSLLALLMSAYIKDTEDMELGDQLQKSQLENELKKITNAESKQENGFPCEENNGIEVIESSRIIKLNGTQSESSRDVADGHQHFSKEDKLGTIMEISGK